MTQLSSYQDPVVIQRLLRQARTVAIVGLSSDELRPSNFVGYYLQRHGLRVLPVNPGEQQILGQTCYPSLREVPVAIDIVAVFRTPAALVPLAHEAVAIGAGALWCQFGVVDLDAARIAADAGLDVVLDRCLKFEHARYAGRLHWLGFNTGRITSVRGGLQ